MNGGNNLRGVKFVTIHIFLLTQQEICCQYFCTAPILKPLPVRFLQIL